MNPMISQDNLDSTLLNEAADWLVRFQSGDNTEAARQAFEQWRSQSPNHAAAWQRAETVLSTFNQVPGDIGRRALKGIISPDRRRALKAFGLFAIATPAIWMTLRHEPWIEWSADLRTATGEQKHLTLADGSRLVMNTNSAIDVSFTEAVRQVRLLRGEILITTASDPTPQPRPFIVETAQGSIRPIGTRFSVRQMTDETRAAVFEGAVAINTLGTEHTLVNAGEYALFQADQINQKGTVENIESLWEHGMLVARNMPLADLVAELARYRSGILRCDPAIADMRVSGAFPLRNTDASLDLLAKTLPLEINSVTRYWVSLAPRNK